MSHSVDCEDGWIKCWSCDGEGDYHDCGEDCCLCARPDVQDRLACRECNGGGGWPCAVCRAEESSTP